MRQRRVERIAGDVHGGAPGVLMVVAAIAVAMMWPAGGCTGDGEPSASGPKAGSVGTPEPKGGDGPGGPSLTLLLTGQARSTLKPCGCSEAQLGGISRRQAVLDRVAPDQRLVIDTGGLLAGDSEQDRIKLETFFQALAVLGYDLVHLDPRDYAIARQRGLIETAAFHWITSTPADAAGPDTGAGLPRRWSRTLTLGGRSVRVIVVAATLDRIGPTGPAAMFETDASSDVRDAASCELRVVITPDEIPPDPQLLEGWVGVDLVICPTASNEPQVLYRPENGATGPWLISVGRLGEYITRLDVGWDGTGRPMFRFVSVAVDNTLPDDPLLVELYEHYKLRIKEAGLLDRMPQFPLPDGLEYVGSGACKSCHEYEYERWSTKPHARAWKTLADINSHTDPECIGCHVVGFGYVSGYRNESSPSDLRDVGCEVCHGPGSAHVASRLGGGRYVPPGPPRSTCTDCHTPDHSVGYAGHEAEYRRKIVHWREP